MFGINRASIQLTLLPVVEHRQIEEGSWKEYCLDHTQTKPTRDQTAVG